MRKLLVAMMVGTALLASGCSRIVASQGYLIDETLLTSIQPGVDNKQSVERTLGRPTLASQFDTNEWYYVSRNTGQYAFIQPKVQSQTILVVTFDGDGNVANVERRGMDKIADVSIESDKTPTLGRKTGIFEDIFGNIGAVGAGGAGGPGGPGGGGPNGGGRQ
jgi:outer membrane protein assembly factor BamE (lipoprotein component of BamABCDE complex)